MSLPKGFKRLEYIQSTGTQHVDTKVIPIDNNQRIVLDHLLPSSPSGKTLFGAENGSSFTIFNYYPNATTMRYYVGETADVYDLTVGTNTRYLLDTHANNGTFTINFNGDVVTKTYSGSLEKASVFLFCSNKNGVAAQHISARVYSCQIYENGALVRDFIPCQTASGEIGLWDAVNEVFYGNAGTGTFTAGPVVPEQVDKSKITELEYIETSGTQYLKTGFIPNQDARMKLKYQTSQTSVGGIAVVDSAWKSNGFGIWVNAAGYGSSVYNSIVMYADDPVEIDFNKNLLYKNGELFWTGTESTFECPSDLTLMALNRNGTIQEYTTGKLYLCMLFGNGLLERDFIPAMLSNGEVGLYDRVFHEFYRNAGTGEFIAGPEMVHEDYTELEHIESSGAQYADSGFVPNQDTRIEMDVVPLSIAEAGGSTGFIPYGAATSYNSNAFECYTTASKLSFNYDGQYSVNGTIMVGAEIHISHNKNVVLVTADRATVVEKTFTYQTFTAPYSLTVCASHRSSMLCGHQKVKSCQIYDDGTAVRIYIPKIHASGVSGLWDTVNERFYASATTTDFIAGPEAETVPKAPANFRVEAETDTLVTLTWDPMEDVLGYRLYRSGQLLADTTEPFISVTVEPFAGAVFTLTAYNENGEGSAAELTYYSIPENPILYLVTDRTQQDVAERNAKGYYAASDLNRVGYAVDYLANIIRGYGYKLEVETKTDWTDEDWKLSGEMVKYLQSLNNLKGVFSTLIELPETMEKINYVDANNIELLLLTIDETIVRVVAGFTRANAFALRSGAKGLPVSYSDRGRNWGQLDSMETTWANWQLATWYLLLYGNLKAEGVVE